MIEKTKNYDMFKFRDDNRQKIDKLHINKLIDSIKERNLLDLRPILVNEDFEVIDGQHRLLAAKHLGIEIYYKVQKDLNAQDIIKMNVSKKWGMPDYFNFYLQHNYPEYIKLKNFMDKNNLSLKVGMNATQISIKSFYDDFKQGKYIFNDVCSIDNVDTCWDTISYIRNVNGYSPYTLSSRFWKALLILVGHPEFDKEKWMLNIKKRCDCFNAKAKTEDYLIIFQNIYNWRNINKIYLKSINQIDEQ